MQAGSDGFQRFTVVEGTVSVDTGADTLDLSDYPNFRYIEITNQGATDCYFRRDGTTPTSSNGDFLKAGSTRLILSGVIANLKFITASSSTTVAYAIYL